MSKVVEIFDPPMCCSTGVCGVDVDPKLIRFAADLDWMKRQHVEVWRYNLAHEPTRFAQQAVIRDLLIRSSPRALPAILVDGVLASQGRYPDRTELAAMVGIKIEDGSETATI